MSYSVQRLTNKKAGVELNGVEAFAVDGIYLQPRTLSCKLLFCCLWQMLRYASADQHSEEEGRSNWDRGLSPPRLTTEPRQLPGGGGRGGLRSRYVYKKRSRQKLFPRWSSSQRERERLHPFLDLFGGVKCQAVARVGCHQTVPSPCDSMERSEIIRNIVRRGVVVVFVVSSGMFAPFRSTQLRRLSGDRRLRKRLSVADSSFPSESWWRPLPEMRHLQTRSLADNLSTS